MRLLLIGPDGHDIHRDECPDCEGASKDCRCEGGFVRPVDCECLPCLRERRELYGRDLSQAFREEWGGREPVVVRVNPCDGDIGGAWLQWSKEPVTLTDDEAEAARDELARHGGEDEDTEDGGLCP